MFLRRLCGFRLKGLILQKKVNRLAPSVVPCVRALRSSLRIRVLQARLRKHELTKTTTTTKFGIFINSQIVGVGLRIVYKVYEILFVLNNTSLCCAYPRPDVFG